MMAVSLDRPVPEVSASWFRQCVYTSHYDVFLRLHAVFSVIRDDLVAHDEARIPFISIL